jgi:2-succinyl-5-enolpyruvyl-6-hydroxy-3-cyclohexene-1-carboxylate synthase
MNSGVVNTGAAAVSTGAADVAATFCATVVDEWTRAGVTDAVLAPGSRSTPMALALAADNRIRLHVFLDERSAGFFALGIALRSGDPAPVLTTSGTAAAELHAAVIESHHAGVPLVAVTADRPPEAQGVGAPQTIDQDDLYGRVLRWRAAPGVPEAAVAAGWRSLAARAVAEARGWGGRPGPVHLNLSFREPLVGRPGPLPPGRDADAPWHQVLVAPRVGPLPMTELAGRLSRRSGVIVGGAGTGDPVAVHHLANLLGWPVLADACSTARTRDRATVAAFDALLRQRSFAGQSRPEVVLRLGATPASRVLAEWLASSGADQIVVSPGGAWLDPDHTAATVLAADTAALCGALVDEEPKPASESWTRLWVDAERAAQDAIGQVLAGHTEPTEPGVARALLAGLRPGTGLVVASSMPIRDVEWYGPPRSDVRVMANRGANGIDGTVSTVLGAAAGSKGNATVGLLGDLAFLHDAGAMLGAAARGLDAVLVVVDNNGGGIFSFLPQATSLPAPLFERIFTTPHHVDLVALAGVHGLAAVELETTAQLNPAVDAALDAGGITVIVVRTDRAANVVVHDEIHAAVSAALDSAVG